MKRAASWTDVAGQQDKTWHTQPDGFCSSRCHSCIQLTSHSLPAFSLRGYLTLSFDSCNRSSTAAVFFSPACFFLFQCLWSCAARRRCLWSDGSCAAGGEAATCQVRISYSETPACFLRRGWVATKGPLPDGANFLLGGAELLRRSLQYIWACCSWPRFKEPLVPPHI